MEDGVLSVREAAEQLGVTSQRVRQLIADGSLQARRSSAGWLVRAQAVADRARSKRRGRPASPRTAWAVLGLLSAAVDAADMTEPPVDAQNRSDSHPFPPAAGGSISETPLASQVIADRRLRHHVLQLLDAMPDPADDIGRWRTLLSSRGPSERMWVHPGVLPRLVSDPDISVGGDEVASTVGEGLSRTEKLDLYVGAHDLGSVVSNYLLRPDENGQVVLHVVPDSVPRALMPQRGGPVPIAAAAADLLEEDDPRASHAAVLQLRTMRNALMRAYIASSSNNHGEVDPCDRTD